MKKRLVRVILKDQAKDEFEKLNRVVGEQQAKGVTNSQEMQLLKSIKQKVDLVKENPMFGDSVPKKLIPRTLDVSNLFCVDLTGHWRMLYSLEGNQVEVVAFILYLVDHPTYDKLFGYKKK
jgi:Txe/YoeB family toxin of Txe-Axe toxin-antitoxin module